jgi:hypothetical protein
MDGFSLEAVASKGLHREAFDGIDNKDDTLCWSCKHKMSGPTQCAPAHDNHYLGSAGHIPMRQISTAVRRKPTERHAVRQSQPGSLAVEINVNASAEKCGVGEQSWHTMT